MTCTPRPALASSKKGRLPSDRGVVTSVPRPGHRPGTLGALARAHGPANRQCVSARRARREGVTKEGASQETRGVVATAFTWLEDVVYVALGILLALAAIGLLVHGGISLVRALPRLDVQAVVALLDQILLALMIVELLYTVKVSFREHAVIAEPFLLVALIAAVRRILVITAEFSAQTRPDDRVFRQVMAELALLTVLVVALVASVVILRRRPTSAEA